MDNQKLSMLLRNWVITTYAENSFLYHVHPCYSNYMKRGDRQAEENTDDKEDCKPEVLGTDESVTSPQT